MTGQLSSIVMACPHCRARLNVPASAMGRQSKCPICQGAVSIPKSFGNREAPGTHARDEFGFNCRSCGSRLYATPAQIGEQLSCPDCHVANQVPQPAPNVARKVFEGGDEFDLRLADDDGPVGDSVALPDATSYRVHCRVCESTFYCRPEQEGTDVHCPDCDSLMRVPPPPPARKPIVLSGADADIEIAPTFDIPVRKSNADRLLAEATEKVEEAERKKQKPPKRPFQEDIWSFPFHWRVFPSWLVLSALGCGTMMLFINGAALASERGIGSIIGLFYLMPLGILLLIVTLMSANIYLSIVQWTAMGYRTIEDWGGVEPFMWVRKLFFLVNALAVSCFPGFVIGLIIPFAWLRLLISGSLIFVIFPYMLLCMLDEETPVTVHSSFIWKTTSVLRPSWLKFYSLTGSIVLSVIAFHAILLALAISTNATWPGYVTIPVANLAATWYFRLVGRLAWVLDEKGQKDIKDLRDIKDQRD